MSQTEVIDSSEDALKGAQIDKQREEKSKSLYGTTNRSDEFTSENFKLEVANLPYGCKYHLVRRLLENNLKVHPHKIRMGTGRAYLAFQSEEDRDNAMLKIHDHQWKGKTLVARPASPRHDPLVKRLKLDLESVNDQIVEDEPLSDSEINSKVCPLFSKDYEDQLVTKDRLIRSTLEIAKQLKALYPALESDSPQLFEWTKKNPKTCCVYDGLVRSPELYGYRNKCEFNVGRDGEIGFRIGCYKNGSERVVRPPKNCPIVSESMFVILDTIQRFLKSDHSAGFCGYDHVSHHGNLRQITIRSNQQNQHMVLVDMHPQDLSEKDLTRVVDSLTEALKTIPIVVSIYFNISSKSHLSKMEETLKHTYGSTHLVEQLIIVPEQPLKFRIGPSSFFQVNSKAAELLYRSISEVAKLDSNCLVLDVGCGTGTISLSLANQVSYVIGIEVVQSAIEDAKVNAKENSISNVSFICGRAEDLINESLSILRAKSTELGNGGSIVAIVDPPRVGFNNSFVKALRASRVEKIIYIACDAKANTNLVSLCRPTSKAYLGSPFVPTHAKAFDLFPHTKFCELLLVYERLKKDEMRS